MNTADARSIVLLRSAVATMVGNAEDNMHRAKSAFRNMTPAQMREQHGSSGVTRQMLLAEYEEHLHDCKGAQHMLDQLLRSKHG